jgi:hypothetical protein
MEVHYNVDWPKTGAVQDLKVAYCPVDPTKMRSLGASAEGYRAMTMTSPYIYRTLLENNLSHHHAHQTSGLERSGQSKTMSTGCTCGNTTFNCHPCPRGKEQVRRAMNQKRHWRIVNACQKPSPPKRYETLCGECTTCFEQSSVLISPVKLLGTEATASVMRFLCLMEVLDKSYTKREKPIWIAKFNFLGLLRVCKSFLAFSMYRNL